jgi:prepilin-type N-terminal cleavage/methylation domain-containing protein
MKINKNISAFTLVEIMIVVAIIGILATIAVSNFMKARDNTKLGLCKNNMRLLGHAAEQYKIDKNLDESLAPEIADVGNYVKGGTPVCPSGGAGTYTFPEGGDTVHCSYTGHGTLTISTGGWSAN